VTAITTVRPTLRATPSEIPLDENAQVESRAVGETQLKGEFDFSALSVEH
jgi:hypothetical protein